MLLQGQAGTNGANNLQQLLSNRPDAVNPIIGYNILPATYNLADLTAGKSLQTTDTAKSGNSVQGTPQTLTVNVTSNSGSAAQVCCMLFASGFWTGGSLVSAGFWTGGSLVSASLGMGFCSRSIMMSCEASVCARLLISSNTGMHESIATGLLGMRTLAVGHCVLCTHLPK